MNDKAVKVKEGIYRFGTNVETEEIGLFEGMWPIPNGASINAYVVMGEKNALIDLVCEWEGQRIEIEDEFKTGGFSIEDIDYIILNHMEPDHSGWLPFVFERNPNIKIVTNARAIELVQNFYHIGITDEEKERIFIEVKDGDTLDLGEGKVLHFAFIPNVHWPETMATYEASQKVLLPCDAFGSYGRIEKGKYFADEVGPEGIAYYKREALRYYANIVASFSTPVLQAIDKVAKIIGLENIDVIAPSHGLMWRVNDKGYGNPAEIVNYYVEMANFSKGPGREKVCVVWGSMYGNTERVLPFILKGIESEGVEYEVFHVPYDHIGFAMSSAFECQGLVVGMPTYEYEMYPPMVYFLDTLKRKKINGKDALRFGSFGWSGGAQKELTHLTSVMKKDAEGKMVAQSTFNFIDPLEWRGRATKEIEEEAVKKGAELARLVKKNAKKD